MKFSYPPVIKFKTISIQIKLFFLESVLKKDGIECQVKWNEIENSNVLMTLQYCDLYFETSIIMRFTDKERKFIVRENVWRKEIEIERQFLRERWGATACPHIV